MRLETLIAVLLLAGPAFAHDAPTGWAYDTACCSGRDCAQAMSGAVRETPRGYELQSTGETVIYRDTRIRQSKDEFFHECHVGGDPKARLLCLYVPNKGY